MTGLIFGHDPDYFVAEQINNARYSGETSISPFEFMSSMSTNSTFVQMLSCRPTEDYVS